MITSTTNRGIVNVFSGQKATPEQETDMLNFCHIGYMDYVTHHILHQPSSVQAPLRCHKLLTMKPLKSHTKNVTQRNKKQVKVSNKMPA